jgi:two-component system alkaline phosphatase synthesis response regulator PhoP
MEDSMTPTVLIVDDDTKFLTFLGRTLKRAGFSVLTASDGADVPEVLSSRRVDVLVLDLQMPGMNGWEVMRSLRERVCVLSRAQDAERPKVIVVSGRNEDETAAFVRRLGADAYLTKPLWAKQVLATVRTVLAN